MCREVVDGPWRGDSNVFTRWHVTELPSLSQKPARVWRASSCIQTCAGWRPGRTAPPRRPRKVGPRRLTPHGTARSLGGCPERRNQMKAGPPLGSQAARAGGQAGGGGRGGSGKNQPRWLSRSSRAPAVCQAHVLYSEMQPRSGEVGGRTGVPRALPDAGDKDGRQKISSQPDTGV